jgi:hypothetical protein
MSEKTRYQTPPSQQVFDFVKMFNRIVVLDEELARMLPEDEFELEFDESGDIYVNDKPLGINVRERYNALHSK